MESHQQHVIDSSDALGRLIKTRRRHLKMNQEMLASLCGIPQPNLSKIETGRSGVNLETCLRLCAALGIDLVGNVRQ
ncbi:helix-turn-helix domain-containing protein [Loktanella sp. DJP18]|uniref:helix-turn-helix domain-containing protein n=1 Tax=Loktanella sp. DJP18 TaxID=3409788 RepID=UPI003BB7BE2D